MEMYTINELCELQVSRTMCKNSVLKLLKPLRSKFMICAQLYDCDTRNGNNPLVLLHRVVIGQNSVGSTDTECGPAWCHFPARDLLLTHE